MLKFRSSVESTSRFTKLNSMDMFQKCFFSVIWFGLAFLVLTVRPMQTSSPDLKMKKCNVDVIQAAVVAEAAAAAAQKSPLNNPGKEDENAGEELTEYTLDGTVDWYGEPALRSKTGTWKSAKFIIGQQACLNMTFAGISKNLVIYLTTVMHQGNATASNFVSNWTGTSYISPLLGALLADSYWGRYKTSLVFYVMFTLGTMLIAIAAYVPSLYPPQCPSKDVHCEPPTPLQSAFLSIGLYIAAIAGGAVQSPVTALGADQFDEEDQVEKKQKSSFFNLFFQAFTLGAMVAAIAIVTIQQDVSWGLGMGLSAGSSFLGLVLVLLGSRLYRLHKPGGNPIARIAQVLVAAGRNWRIGVVDSNELYELHDVEGSSQGRKILHTDEYMFLDKAGVQTKLDKIVDDLQVNPWRLCTITQIEEVKCLIRFCPVFLTSVLYTTVYMQLGTLFVVQGATMDTNIFGTIKIAPATLSVVENISVVSLVFVYDRLLVPFVCKYTRHPRGFTDLQRIGIGFALSAIAMAVAALVETRRLSMAKHYGLLDDSRTPIPMSILWEIPQYFLVGASEVFAYIGLMEFFYDKSPDALRSVGSALSLLSNAIGSYISTLLVTMVNNVTSKEGNHSQWIPDNLNRGHVDRFYWLLVLVSVLNLAAFMVCARCYRCLQQEPLPTKISGDTIKSLSPKKKESTMSMELVRHST